MRTAVIFIVVIAVGAALGIGLKQAASKNDSADLPKAQKLDPAEVKAKFAGAPAPLAALHAQAGQLISGGPDALKARLAELKGHPAVVNLWASWCGPCNVEAPVLQKVTLDRGRDVAFLGVDFQDSRDGAKRFLKRYPATYPSVEDPDAKIYDAYKLGSVPATIYYDASGKQVYAHRGPYLSEAEMQRDIDRYALGGTGRS